MGRVREGVIGRGREGRGNHYISRQGAICRAGEIYPGTIQGQCAPVQPDSKNSSNRRIDYMNTMQKVNRILEIVLIFLTSILVLDVLWQVFSRYVLSSPSSFTDELAGYLLIWVSLLGAAYVAGRREHLAIDIMLQRSGPARQRILRIIIQSVILGFSFTVLVIGGSWLVYTRFYLGVTSAALQIPLGYVYIVLPASGLLIVFYS